MADYRQWLDSTHTRPDGSIAEIQTRWAVLDVGSEKDLAADTRSMVSQGTTICLVSDDGVAFLVERLKKALVDQGLKTIEHVIPKSKGEHPPSADDHNVALLQKTLQQHDIGFVVAIGSGTNNDVAKYASFLEEIPYSVYGTAASMNGYNSGIAALYMEGLKSTIPCNPPVGMYADPEVIAKAPLIMTLAGLGDLCSKPFAGADAAIASIVQESPLWRLPTNMVVESFEEALAMAEKIGQGDATAVASLMEALWISGFSMVLAGSSAPASGGEHLWSHRLDMARHDQGLPIQALHGTQVGVACNLVRPLFQKVAELSKEQVESSLQQPYPEPEPGSKHFEGWLKIRHTHLTPQSLQKVVQEAQRKYNRNKKEKFRAGLLKHWDKIQTELLDAKHHADRVQQALQKAQAPCTPEEIGVKPHESEHILTVCRDIRDRQTILDLSAELIGEKAFMADVHDG